MVLLIVEQFLKTKGGNRISAITIGIICEEYNKGKNTWQLLNEMAM